MKLLYEIDKKNYKENGTSFSRPSVRGIIVKEGKIAMIHSLKYDYYKFPGGGIEKGENHFQALIREVKEETGLEVISSSIKEFGYIHRIEKGKKEDIFIQDNYYYFCDISENVSEQNLDDYENEEEFTLEFVLPETAINTNRNHSHNAKDNNTKFITMVERENRILEMLKENDNV